jgi:hypothetical protein
MTHLQTLQGATALLAIPPDDWNEFKEMLSRCVEQLDKLTAASTLPLARKSSDTKLYLTRREAAKTLRISVQTLNSYARKGLLKPVKIERRVLYPTEQIEGFAQQHETVQA